MKEAGVMRGRKSYFRIPKKYTGYAEAAMRRLSRSKNVPPWLIVSAVNGKDSLFGILAEWGWIMSEDSSEIIPSRGIYDPSFEKMMKALSPYVSKGSFIEVENDQKIWRWTFDGTLCRKQYGRLVFG